MSVEVRLKRVELGREGFAVAGGDLTLADDRGSKMLLSDVCLIHDSGVPLGNRAGCTNLEPQPFKTLIGAMCNQKVQLASGSRSAL